MMSVEQQMLLIPSRFNQVLQNKTRNTGDVLQKLKHTSSLKSYVLHRNMLENWLNKWRINKRYN
jgi:hypothetical protein